MGAAGAGFSGIHREQEEEEGEPPLGAMDVAHMCQKSRVTVDAIVRAGWCARVRAARGVSTRDRRARTCSTSPPHTQVIGSEADASLTAITWNTGGGFFRPSSLPVAMSLFESEAVLSLVAIKEALEDPARMLLDL